MPLILIFLSIVIIKDIKYRNLLKKESILFISIFFLYVIFNILNKDNHLTNLFWPIYMFLAFFFVTSIINENDIKSLIKLTIFILFIAFIFYFSLAVADMIKTKNPNFYGILGDNSSYSGFKNPPRSSGLARMAIILFSYFLLYFLLKKNNTKRNYKILTLICVFAIIANIFQARTISFIYIIINLILILFYFDKFMNNKKIFLFTLIIPLIVNSSYNYFKYDFYLKENFDKETYKNYDNKLNLLGYVVKNSVLRDQNKDTSNSFSSGRFDNWKYVLEISKKNPFIGHGPQSDRIYLNQSIHNGKLYVLLSGGLIALVCFIFIYIKILIFFIKFFTIKNLKLNFNYSFSLMLIIILCLRSILETSFAIYSIDYLIFILTFFNLNNFFYKNKNA